MFGIAYASDDEQLWVVDLKTLKFSSLRYWRESFQGSSPATTRWIEGWLRDQTRIVIAGAISYGFEKPADGENDWVKMWLIDTRPGKGNGAEIFDSGKGCLDAAWWSGGAG